MWLFEVIVVMWLFKAVMSMYVGCTFEMKEVLPN